MSTIFDMFDIDERSISDGDGLDRQTFMFYRSTRKKGALDITRNNTFTHETTRSPRYIMMTHDTNEYTIEIGKKIDPAPYLNEGWRLSDGVACFSWESRETADMWIDLPSSDDLFLLAEISATSDAFQDRTAPVKVFLNGDYIEEWTIHSSSIYDKFALIPVESIRKRSPCELSFRRPAGSWANRVSAETPGAPGMRVHSISFGVNLDAALKELQSGYDWYSRCRDDLVDVARRVLTHFRNMDGGHDRIIAKLRSIIDHPYVRSPPKTEPVFNRDYFEANYQNLKEGLVIREIRQWAADLATLNRAIIDAGNWATNRPRAKRCDPENLARLLQGRRHVYSENVKLLRERNETLNNLEILLGKETIRSVPSTIYLDVTSVCNFRCKMCYQSQSHFPQTKIFNEHMAIVIDMLPYFGNITVAGLGEPLLCKRLRVFSEAAKALRCHTRLVTNGSLIRNRLETLENFSIVSISFDGAVAETFETLRHGSKFNGIVDNIRRLSKHAPDLTIAFSVVASRANIDELAAIVRLAGELGVDEVGMNPMENMPVLELKASDRPRFEKQIAEAEKLAERHSISLLVNIDPEIFSSRDDEPWDKKKTLNFVRSLEVKKERRFDIGRITENLETLQFPYYPAPVVFTREDSPEPRAHQGIPVEESRDPDLGSSMDPDDELAEINERIDRLETEIKRRTESTCALPYCLDPWKLNYIRSDGKNRLCCHADMVVGALGEQGFRNAINSEEQQKIRQAMMHRRALPPACEGCRAADRFIGLDSLRKTAARLKIKLENNGPVNP